MTTLLALTWLVGCNTCEEGSSSCKEEDTGSPATDTTTPVSVGNDVDLASFPPVVIGTTPSSGDLGLAPSTIDLEVSFSKPMADGSWAWVQVNQPFPETGGGRVPDGHGARAERRDSRRGQRVPPVVERPDWVLRFVR